MVGLTILVVDDDPDVRTVLHACLEGAGYVVVALNDGAAARRFFEAGGRAALILIDVVLPDESGLALAGWIARTFRLPIVLLSGEVDTFRRLEEQPYIRVGKPFRVPALLRLIAQEIAAAAPRPTIASGLVGVPRSSRVLG